MVNCCWETLRFHSDFFFFFLTPSYHPFVCRSCKRIKDGEEKDKDTFKLNSYFGGLKQFCGMKCFPEPAPRVKTFEENHGITFGKLQIQEIHFVSLYSTEVIGFTLLYLKMDVMPLFPETKMADVSILISLGNLLAWRTTCLVLKTTSATSIFSCVFKAYSMTKIFYKYSNLPTLTLFFIISLGESTQLSFTFSLTGSTHSSQGTIYQPLRSGRI